MSEVIAFRIDKDLKDFLKLYAEKNNLERSVIIRDCIRSLQDKSGETDERFEKARLMRRLRELKAEESFLFKLRKTYKRSGEYLRKMHTSEPKSLVEEKLSILTIDERREAIVKEMNQIMKRLREIWEREGKLEKFEKVSE